MLVLHPCAGTAYNCVSYSDEHAVRVYRVEADGTAALLYTVGCHSTGLKQCKHPFKMCLSPAGSLLVCDYGNGRVQDLTELSEAELQQMH